eukprot:9314700-Alexandrium_andersonii.AAC.1
MDSTSKRTRPKEPEQSGSKPQGHADPHMAGKSLAERAAARPKGQKGTQQQTQEEVEGAAAPSSPAPSSPFCPHCKNGCPACEWGDKRPQKPVPAKPGVSPALDSQSVISGTVISASSQPEAPPPKYLAAIQK